MYQLKLFDNFYLFKINKIMIISIYRVLIEIFQYTRLKTPCVWNLVDIFNTCNFGLKTVILKINVIFKSIV
jgi:hypothetical protein